MGTWSSECFPWQASEPHWVPVFSSVTFRGAQLPAEPEAQEKGRDAQSSASVVSELSHACP